MLQLLRKPSRRERDEEALTALFTGHDLTTRLPEQQPWMGRLNRFSDEPGKLTRLYLSPAHKQAAEWVKGAMEVAGLAAFVDAAGSVQGRREGTVPGAPAVLIGSHIDTVKDGGRFDGNLGVVAGILAAQALRDAGIVLPFALEVVAFGDEETVRFPTDLSTSHALIGGLVAVVGVADTAMIR